jgi:hypothetical protein
MSSVSDGIYKDLKYPAQIAEVTFSNGTVGRKMMHKDMHNIVFQSN